MASAALRQEAAQTYAVLEANQTLSDGNQQFVSGYNTTTGTTFAAALQAFRSLTTVNGGSELSGIQPKVFVVPSSYETAIRNEITQAGIQIDIVATPSVSNFYLLADPQQAPSLIRLSLSENPVITSRAAKFESSGIVLDMTHDFKIAACDRSAIIKMAVA
jgi:hypothetical protein